MDLASPASTEWMGFRWTAWMPLMAAHPLALAQLPSMPGVYRVRRARAPERLEWLGWEGRGIRQTVERLARQVHLPSRPYDDPAGPALHLWQVRQSEHGSFEVSGAALTVSDADGWALQRSLWAAYHLWLAEDPICAPEALP